MDSLQEQRSVRLRQRLWGAAVLIALLVIFLPLLLDGSGSESQYRRVERLRAEPPRIINSDGELEINTETISDSSVLKVNSTSGRSSQSDRSASARQGDQVTQGQQEDQVAQGLQDDQVTQGQQEDQAAQGQQGDSSVPGQQDDRIEQIYSDEQNEQNDRLAEASKPINSDSVSDGRPADRGSPNTEQLRAWVVQAGSFADEDNAIAVRDKLRRAGHPSFVTPTNTEPPVYRVRVGPMIDLKQAESKRDKVIDYLGREAIVVSYP